MTITERLELIRAGYTKEEIASFETGAVVPEEPKAEIKVEEPIVVDPEKPTAADPEKKDDSAVLNAIHNLTKAIQAQNLQRISLDTPGGLSAEQARAQGVFGNK